MRIKKWGPTVQSRNLTSIVYSKISKLKVQDLNEMFTLESQRMLFDRAFLDFVDLKHVTTRNSSIIGIPLDIPRVNMTYVRKGFRNDSGRNKAAISSMKRRNHCLNTCDSENTSNLIYKIYMYIYIYIKIDIHVELYGVSSRGQKLTSEKKTLILRCSQLQVNQGAAGSRGGMTSNGG